MTYGHLQADCLYTGISSGPNARYRVWEAFTFFYHCRESLYFTMGRPFLPLHGGSGPHLINGSLGPPESSTQTTSQSVQLLCRAHSHDRLTERPCCSICNNRQHLYSTVMRPGNNYSSVGSTVIMTSHCMSSPGTSDECRLCARWPPTLNPNRQA